MKNSNKLKQINQKIEDLKVLQKKLEDDFVKDLSKQIEKIIRKKNIFDFDKSQVLNKIEIALDELLKEDRFE